MRRVPYGAAIGVILTLLLGTGAAHALWGVSRPGPAVQVRSGTLGVSATWSGGTPVWSALTPGQSVEGILTITGTGSGRNLGWGFTLAATYPTAAAGQVTMQAFTGGCSGTPLPAGGYPTAGSLTATQSTNVCLRFTLAASAPSSVAGQVISPTITVTATQRSS